MSGQRTSPHWWPEGWRLFAAAMPHFFRRPRRTIFVGVVAGGAAIGALLGLWIALVFGESAAWITVFSIVIAVAAAHLSVTVFLRAERGDRPMDGYVSDAQSRIVRAAAKSGDFTAVDRDVRRVVVSSAEFARRALPGAILGEVIMLPLWVVGAVAYVAAGDLVPAIVLCLMAILYSGTLFANVWALGSTTATFGAEASALAREAEESSR